MQQKLTLVLGSKTRSSWSLRPWLFLRHHEVPFEEIVISLDQKDTRARILDHSPSGKVPCLLHGPIKVWESLAICEYAAETLALPAAWPMDPSARALARSMTSEMHAGFETLRRELPFDALRKPAPQALGPQAAEEVARVRALWREARNQHGRGGPWLFGRFGIADAMYAPVALRFHAYGVELDGAEREYVFNLLMHPAVQEWLDAAAQEQPAQEPPLAETLAERTAEILVMPEPSEALDLPPTTAPAAALAAEPMPVPAPAAARRYVDDPAVTQETFPAAETHRDLPYDETQRNLRPEEDQRQPDKVAAPTVRQETLAALMAPRDPASKPAPMTNPVIEHSAAEPAAGATSEPPPTKLRSVIMPP